MVKVVDGDTFDVQLKDSLISEDLIRIRPADPDRSNFGRELKQ